MKAIFSLFALLLTSLTVFAQSPKIQSGKGNAAYRDSLYQGAIDKYSEALEADGDFTTARFNRANAMVRQAAKIAAEAAKMDNDSLREMMIQNAQGFTRKAASDFESIAQLAEDDRERNKARFNQGNAHLLGGEIDKSIDAYKHALRIDPRDDEARYNLAFAQRLRQQQQQEQKPEESDEGKDQKDDQKQENKPSEEDKNNEPQEQQPDQLTKEEAEKLLEAMLQREKELQDEINKRKAKSVIIKVEKDW